MTTPAPTTPAPDRGEPVPERVETDRATFVLVPGWWLGAWAWDVVAADLRARGHRVVPMTLPGLESTEADRSGIGLEDHVAAVVAAVAEASAAGDPVVLVSHSGAAIVATGAADRVPQLVRRLVFVDTAPVRDGTALAPDVPAETVERPLPSFDELRADGEDLTGLTEEHLAEFRARAVPQPTGPLREAVALTHPARTAIPVTVVATAFTPEQAQEWAEEGSPYFSGLLDSTDVAYVELPTSHWPMFSRPADLAGVLDEVAAS